MSALNRTALRLLNLFGIIAGLLFANFGVNRSFFASTTAMGLPFFPDKA